jgi:hypothetical protein
MAILIQANLGFLKGTSKGARRSQEGPGGKKNIRNDPKRLALSVSVFIGQSVRAEWSS